MIYLLDSIIIGEYIKGRAGVAVVGVEVFIFIEFIEFIKFAKFIGFAESRRIELKRIYLNFMDESGIV